MRGGGGGNFGVISKYRFKNLPPAFSGADITAVSVDWSDITEWKVLQQILQVLADYSKNVGNDITRTNRQWSRNIFALGKFQHHSQSQIAFVLQSAWNTAAEQRLQHKQIDNFVGDIEAISAVSPTYLRSTLAGYPTLDSISAERSLTPFLTSLHSTQLNPWLDRCYDVLERSGPNGEDVIIRPIFERCSPIFRSSKCSIILGETRRSGT